MKARLLLSLGIALIPFLFISAPFIIFLKSNHISFLAEGMFSILALKLLIVYLCFAALIFISDVFRGLLLALSILFFLDYQVKFEDLYEILSFKSTFFDSDRFYLLYIGLGLLILGIAFWVFYRLNHVQYMALLVLFGGVFTFLLFTPSSKQNERFKDVLHQNLDHPKTTHMPGIVNIVLNGHGALDAMDDSIPAVKEAKESIFQFHQKHNLILFTHALSQYASAEDTISNQLNFSQDPRHRSFFEGQRKFLTLHHNNYFAYLNDKGYVFNVYQHKAMNFCAPNRAKIARCFTYNEEFPIQMVHSLDEGHLKRDLILDEYLRSSFLLKTIGKFLNVEFQQLFGGKFSYAQSRKPLNSESLMLLKELNKDVLEKGGSRVYFAHLNLPEEPYMLNKDCSLRPYSEGWYLKKTKASDPNLETKKAILTANQLQCVYKTLDTVFESWKTKGIYDDLLVTIQGDKGFSFLAAPKDNTDNPETIAPKLDRDLYATHFSYRKAPLQFATSNLVYMITDMFTALIKLHPFAEEKNPNVFAIRQKNVDELVRKPYKGKP